MIQIRMVVTLASKAATSAGFESRSGSPGRVSGRSGGAKFCIEDLLFFWWGQVC